MTQKCDKLLVKVCLLKVGITFAIQKENANHATAFKAFLLRKFPITQHIVNYHISHKRSLNTKHS